MRCTGIAVLVGLTGVFGAHRALLNRDLEATCADYCDCTDPVGLPTCYDASVANTTVIVTNSTSGDVVDSVTVSVSEELAGFVSVSLTSEEGNDINSFWFNLRNVDYTGTYVEPLTCDQLTVTVNGFDSDTCGASGAIGAWIYGTGTPSTGVNCVWELPPDGATVLTASGPCVPYDCGILFADEADSTDITSCLVTSVNFTLTVPPPTPSPTSAPTIAPTLSPTAAVNGTQAPTSAPTAAPTMAPTIPITPAFMDINFMTGELVGVSVNEPSTNAAGNVTDLSGVSVLSCAPEPDTEADTYVCYSMLTDGVTESNFFTCETGNFSAAYNFTFENYKGGMWSVMNSVVFYSDTLGADVTLDRNDTDGLWYVTTFASSLEGLDGAATSGVTVPVVVTCPTPAPTPMPTAAPTMAPTIPVTDKPTPQPTPMPTAAPTLSPTVATSEPTAEPTSEPTVAPTIAPTLATPEPTAEPTSEPTVAPTIAPTVATSEPTAEPTSEPTAAPTMSPTVSTTCVGKSKQCGGKNFQDGVDLCCEDPTTTCTVHNEYYSACDTIADTAAPTLSPTMAAVTDKPTEGVVPTAAPTIAPTTVVDTDKPTEAVVPTAAPTIAPTTAVETDKPTEVVVPTPAPADASVAPTLSPTVSTTACKANNAQCGGKHFEDGVDSCCEDPAYTCTYHNEYYSQCEQGTAAPTMAPTAAPTMAPTVAVTSKPSKNKGRELAFGDPWVMPSENADDGWDCYAVCSSAKSFSWCAGGETTAEDCGTSLSECMCTAASQGLDIRQCQLSYEICLNLVMLGDITHGLDCNETCGVWPTPAPTVAPTPSPTVAPTMAPTFTTEPVTEGPTPQPTDAPTMAPTVAATEGCSENWKQCGGDSSYTGPTCCKGEDWDCYIMNQYYSQCRPMTVAPTAAPTIAPTGSSSQAPERRD